MMREPHMRFLALHALGGIAAGLAAAALLLALDVASIRTLALNSSEGWIAVALLGFGFAVTFGSAALGAAVMGQVERDAAPPPRRPGGLPVLLPGLAPALLRARAPRRR